MSALHNVVPIEPEKKKLQAYPGDLKKLNYTRRAKYVWGAICDTLDRDKKRKDGSIEKRYKGDFYKERSRVANDWSISEKTIQRGIQELRKGGAMCIYKYPDGGRGCRTEYHLHAPDEHCAYCGGKGQWKEPETRTDCPPFAPSETRTKTTGNPDNLSKNPDNLSDAYKEEHSLRTFPKEQSSSSRLKALKPADEDDENFSPVNQESNHRGTDTKIQPHIRSLAKDTVDKIWRPHWTACRRDLAVKELSAKLAESPKPSELAELIVARHQSHANYYKAYPPQMPPYLHVWIRDEYYQQDPDNWIHPKHENSYTASRNVAPEPQYPKNRPTPEQLKRMQEAMKKQPLPPMREAS